jgi:hypothetical protein
MAAVRNVGCVVYELDDAIENLLASSQSGEGSPWLRRSFQVAEQFILARAAVVIVHSEEMRERLRIRGVAGENLFVACSWNSTEAGGDLVHRYDAAYGHAHGKTQRPVLESKVFLPPRYSL